MSKILLAKREAKKKCSKNDNTKKILISNKKIKKIKCKKYNICRNNSLKCKT